MVRFLNFCDFAVFLQNFSQFWIFVDLCEIMEACQGVERDINNVADKFSNLGESNHRILEEAIQLVRAAKDEIRDGKGIIFLLFPN